MFYVSILKPNETSIIYNGSYLTHLFWSYLELQVLWWWQWGWAWGLGYARVCAYLFDFTPQDYLPMGLQLVSTWDGSAKVLGEAWQGFE